MRISEVKQEYQLQEWRGMLREQKESGLFIKVRCQEQGLAEYIDERKNIVMIGTPAEARHIFLLPLG